MPSWVIVDDFDSGIAYDGPWMWSIVITSDVTQEVAYNNSGHMLLSNATSSQAGSFSYNFAGSQVAVYGNSTIFNISTVVSSSGAQGLPTWECLVDGTPIQNNDPFGSFPWQSFCETSTLEDGPHTLDVQISDTGNYGFSMDFIRYVPMAEIVANGTLGTTGATAWLNASDPAIVFGAGWAPLASGMMTFASSGVGDGPSGGGDPAVFMEFLGSSLTWYGLSKDIVFSQSANIPSLSINFTGVISGSYQIDADDRIPFALNLSDTSQLLLTKANPYTTVLFRTPDLVPGGHNLSVWYDGGSAMWPLTLDYLSIENGFSSTPVSVASTHKSKSAVVGGAVGGVLGGILLILLGLFLVRQRRVMQRKKRVSDVRHWANADIKLRPVSRMLGPEDGGDKAQKYPFSFEGKNQGQI